MKERLSVTNLTSEYNLSMFRLNASVVIRMKVKKCEQTLLFLAKLYLNPSYPIALLVLWTWVLWGLKHQNPFIGNKKCEVWIYWKLYDILSCMWTLSYFIDHASSCWPPLAPLFSLTIPNNNTKNKHTKTMAGTSHKSFLNENKRM